MANEQKSWQARIARGDRRPSGRTSSRASATTGGSTSRTWPAASPTPPCSPRSASSPTPTAPPSSAASARSRPRSTATAPPGPASTSSTRTSTMCVEKALIDKVGEPGRKLHTGRSRNDQVAQDLAMWIDDAARTLMQRVGRCSEGIWRARSKEHRHRHAELHPPSTSTTYLSPVPRLGRGLQCCSATLTVSTKAGTKIRTYAPSEVELLLEVRFRWTQQRQVSNFHLRRCGIEKIARPYLSSSSGRYGTAQR